MGVVFAAWDRVRNEEMALKLLLPHLVADPRARERFVNEATIARGLTVNGLRPSVPASWFTATPRAATPISMPCVIPSSRW
jgi:hypothetical protein